MTPEQRLDRAERMLLLLVNAGRRTRTQWRAEHREMDEKINIIINTQIETGELLKITDEQLKRNDEQIESLIASQAKTDEALRRFIDGLSKGPNEN